MRLPARSTRKRSLREALPLFSFVPALPLPVLLPVAGACSSVTRLPPSPSVLGDFLFEIDLSLDLFSFFFF